MGSCKTETSLVNNNHMNRSQTDNYIFLRVCVPDLNIRKCFQFCKNDNISDIKQQCITSLPVELKQSFNYGLFCPPTGTKCGKFLDEEKLLNEYPFSDHFGYLELRFKQRIYKSSKIDEKQFKAINTKANLRRFLEYVRNGQIEKVTKMCSKGLDPNFHCMETGETPLTLASTLPRMGKFIIALVNGGAFLDFRNLAGSTALHRAVDNNNSEALITLLELGASPNCKDSRGLTPLYLSITRKSDVLICERLLREKANIGAQDVQGWFEVHHACRYGLTQHLEHLLFYGADMNARNASGNTPLHVCAVNGQEACTQVLLQKGALIDALNYANQTPCQVAVIAGNLELANIIQSSRAADLERTISECSDVISNNSSGIGTANGSDLTESSFASKINDNPNTSNLEDNFKHPSMCKSRSSICCENSINELLMLPIYRPSKNLKEKTGIANKNYATTAPREKQQLLAEPRTVRLHKTKRGFGFVLRGAKATSCFMDIKYPALQYLDDVDKGSVADLAGLRKGDYILAINDSDVSNATHSEVVDLIRNSGKFVTMTVVSCSNLRNLSYLSFSKYNEWQASSPPKGWATLPNKFKKSRPLSAGYIAPLPPRRDPKTALSMNEIKSRTMFSKTSLWDSNDSRHNSDVSGKPKTASIRSRPISSRITTAELEELFQRQAELSPVCRNKSDSRTGNSKLIPEKTELRRSFYSVPDLVQITINNTAEEPVSLLRNHKSQDNVNGYGNSLKEVTPSCSSQTTYSSNTKLRSRNDIYGHCPIQSAIGVNSSFKPNNQAVIYGSSNFRELSNTYGVWNNRNQVRKSASLKGMPQIPFVNHPPGSCHIFSFSKSNRNSFTDAFCLSPPTIPSPDYSQSDEDEISRKAFKTSTLPMPNTLRGVNHFNGKNFDLEEIRKARSQLRSSVAFPVNYIIGGNLNEDGDNSSSGVSSDQEVAIGSTNETKNVTKKLTQLPNAGSVSTSKEGQLVVLPPPEFVCNVSSAAIEVLEPPPQFSDRSFN